MPPLPKYIEQDDLHKAGFPYEKSFGMDKIPTLQYLITQCGQDFRFLLLHTSYKKQLEKPWEAVPNKKRRPNVKAGKGSTPLEAVENLWLNLNK